MTKKELVEQMSELVKPFGNGIRHKLSWTMKRWELELVADYILSILAEKEAKISELTSELAEAHDLSDSKTRVLIEKDKRIEEIKDEFVSEVNTHNMSKRHLCDRIREIKQLQSKLNKAVGILEEFKHQNHHTIEEEKWRIDNAIDTLKGE